MRKFFVLSSFFSLMPVVLVASIMLFSYHYHKTNVLGAATVNHTTQPFAYAALPTSENVFEGSATFTDKRTTNLADFFTQYHSPLAPYANLIVSKADDYGIDYRLLPAIAMQETTLCQKTLPAAPHNCWGWGIYGKHVTDFGSFDEAIDTITRYFANKKESGIASLDEIGSVYNPGNTSHWKENVAHFMAELQELDFFHRENYYTHMYWKASAEYREKDRDGVVYEGTHTRYGKYKATAWARREWALLQFKFISARFDTELKIGKKSSRRVPGKWIRP